MSDADLHVGGLSIWVLEREFPDASDYWDSNWLVVRADMRSAHASVTVEGPILMTTDFQRFRDQLAALHESMAATASLSSAEPNLKLELAADRLGHIRGAVEITPDHMTESHRFEIELDQTFVPGLITACDAILTRFPVRGRPDA